MCEGGPTGQGPLGSGGASAGAVGVGPGGGAAEPIHLKDTHMTLCVAVPLRCSFVCVFMCFVSYLVIDKLPPALMVSIWTACELVILGWVLDVELMVLLEMRVGLQDEEVQ